MIVTTIYVDELRPHEIGVFKHGYCHMTCDGNLNELHKFAAEIGLKREWFHDHSGCPHYDLTPADKLSAIKKGALADSLRKDAQG